jgi:hypothetical protein
VLVFKPEGSKVSQWGKCHAMHCDHHRIFVVRFLDCAIAPTLGGISRRLHRDIEPQKNILYRLSILQKQ